MTNIYFPCEEVTSMIFTFVLYGGAYCPSVEATQQVCGEIHWIGNFN